MKIRCPNENCNIPLPPTLKIRLIVRNGTFFRRSDSRRINRYRCTLCTRTFCKSTFRPSYYQKKRRLTKDLKKLMCASVSQRRAARILNVDRKTIVRRFRYIAEMDRIDHETWMKKNYSDVKATYIQFDDLETSEHTKCKPLSVTLAIDAKTRKILKFKVSSMPAKGLLAEISRKKYGYRKDERPASLCEMMSELKPYVHSHAHFASDENPLYPKYLKKHHPYVTHKRVLGGRGAITGQGELKKLRFDPIFALNHTCAMLRANLNRLVRRTWCTTKNQQGLKDHLAIYVSYHNRVLTPLREVYQHS